METTEKAPAHIVILSVMHVCYLMSLPVLTNITLIPLLNEHTVNAVFWAIFGLMGMPVAFAGQMSLSPFPINFPDAVVRTFFIPVTGGLLWWYLDGALLEYFAILLVYEFMAIYLSLFLMSFIPLGYYDPENPKANDRRTYWNILILQGFAVAGGFMLCLSIAIWPWASNMQYWHHPLTYVFLLFAATEYIRANFKTHKENRDRWEGTGKTPRPFKDRNVSIEGVLLLSPIPWLISIAIINKGLM